MGTTIIYTHPDGHEVAVGNGLLTAVTSDGIAVSIPVGHAGLAGFSLPLVVSLDTALLHKWNSARHDPSPRRTHPTAATATVSGRPSWLNRFSKATRMCSSTTCRSKVRAMTRSPKRLKQCILVSTKLRRW